MENAPKAPRDRNPCQFPSLFVLAISLASLFLTFPPGAGRGAVSPSEFLRLSQSIFRGRVVQCASFFDADTGDVLTRYLFQVDETYKGQEKDQFEIIGFGGTLGTLTMVVPHEASYRQGREYLVFAWLDGFGRGRTLGGSQGGLPLVSVDGGSLRVRLETGHPLESLVAERRGYLVDFQTFTRAIREAVKSSLKDARD